MLFLDYFLLGFSFPEKRFFFRGSYFSSACSCVMFWVSCLLKGLKVWGAEGLTSSWAIEGLRSWRVEGLNGWGVERLRGWRVEGLQGWGVEGLRGWGVEGLRDWRVEGLNDWGIEGLRGCRVEGLRGWRFELHLWHLEKCGFLSKNDPGLFGNTKNTWDRFFPKNHFFEITKLNGFEFSQNRQKTKSS